MEEEKKAGYKWLVIVFGSVALLAIGAYTWNFWGWPPSGKTQDWANFATYISGTVGVAAVVATLMAFVITLMQQQKLIDQQKEQIKQTDKHQIRLNAFQRASVLLPSALKALESHLDKNLGQLINDEAFEVFEIQFITKRYRVCDFFIDDNVLLELMREKLVVQNFIGGQVTREVYELAKFVAEILQDEPDLYDVVMMQLKNYREILVCTMAYQRKNKKLEEWLFISRIFRLPENYDAWGEPGVTWQALGHKENGENKT